MYTETQRHRVVFDYDYDYDYDYDFFPLFFVFRLSSPRSLQAPLQAPLLLKEGEGWLSSSIEGLGVVKQLHGARDV